MNSFELIPSLYDIDISAIVLQDFEQDSWVLISRLHATKSTELFFIVVLVSHNFLFSFVRLAFQNATCL
jgi:hypothetical protein